MPFTPVPVTFQVFAVLSCGVLLKPKYSFISVLSYIFLGLSGLPVFAGIKPGISVLLGPTGGFVWGFLFAVIIVGITYEIFNKYFSDIMFSMICAMALGLIVIYISGSFHFAYISHRSWAEALSLTVVPFIIPDIIKLAAAVLVSKTVLSIYPLHADY